MYPNITLEIKNHIPSLIYYKSDSERTKITLENESFLEIIASLAKALNLIAKDRELEELLSSELLNLARESDETFILDFPDFDTEGLEFKMDQAIKSFLENTKIVEDFSKLNTTEEIKAELTKNQNADIFASALDYLYTIMAAKALLAASEMGIGTIRLDDDSKNTRLQEKLALELERMGVDLIVE